MKTEVIKIGKGCEEDIVRAGEILKQGGLVAFPTETVYGLGGDALNAQSAEKIYAAKGRPSDNPLIVHICRMEDLEQIVATIPENAYRLAKAFWPGPMTLILPKSELVPRETTGGLDTVAVRFPSDETAQKLIAAAGGYVAAPSANLSGKPSPTLAKYVLEDMDGRIDMILDGGDIPIGLESTIVDCTVEPPMILRPGFITEQMLAQVVGSVEQDKTMMLTDTGAKPKAPGMKYRHYAPRGELTIYQGDTLGVVEAICRQSQCEQAKGHKVGIIATDENLECYQRQVKDAVIKSAGSREDAGMIAHRLYQILREFDEENVEIISSEAFDYDGLGQAIMNRLLKAAGHRVVTV